MSDPTLWRISALAAVAGGALRVANTFAGALGDAIAQRAYLATDVLLAVGLCGIYLDVRGAAGRAGLAGAAVALIGILMVRSADLFGGYATGAAVILLGTACLGAAILRRSEARTWPTALAPSLWILSLAIGLASALTGQEIIGAAAGVTFGAAFVAAGLRLHAGRRDRDTRRDGTPG